MSIILSEHRTLGAVIRSLQYLARDAEKRPADLDEDLFAMILNYIDAFPNRFHHPKEDQYLFKALRQRSPAASDLLDELQSEHARGDEMVGRLRSLLERCRADRTTVGTFTAAVEEYADFNSSHLRKEEDVVLPLTERVLTPTDWRAIGEAFQGNTDPLLGRESREEFRRLFDHIVTLAPWQSWRG